MPDIAGAIPIWNVLASLYRASAWTWRKSWQPPSTGRPRPPANLHRRGSTVCPLIYKRSFKLHHYFKHRRSGWTSCFRRSTLFCCSIDNTTCGLGKQPTNTFIPAPIFWSGMMLKPENHQTYLFKAYAQKAAGNGLMLRPICNPAGHRFGGGASLKSWKMPKGGLRRSVFQNHNNLNLQRSSCATACSEHRRGGRLALRRSRSQHWPVILP